MKPNLWLLVNPNIACPIQYNEINADVGPVCEPAEESQTRLLETQCPLTAERQVFSCHDGPLQGELVQSVSEYTVHTNRSQPLYYASPVSVCSGNLTLLEC